MSEELKKTDIKKIAGRGCLIVAGILFLFEKDGTDSRGSVRERWQHLRRISIL